MNQLLLPPGVEPFSDDTLDFGLEDFYFDSARALMSRCSPHPVPKPSEFSIRNPRHVATMALYGVVLMPADKAACSAMVDDGGSYTRRVKSRVAAMRARFRAHESAMASMGVRLVVVPDGGKPGARRAPANRIPRSLLPFPPVLASYASQLEKDDAYLKSKRLGRLNMLAKEYGQANFGELQRFQDQLDVVAAGWGFVDYKTLTQPDQFLEVLLTAKVDDDRQGIALKALLEHRNVLRTRPPMEMLLFVSSKAGEVDEFGFEVEGGLLYLTLNAGSGVVRYALDEATLSALDILNATGTLRD